MQLMPFACFSPHGLIRIVKGAHEGAGLGNKFLTNIRQTDAIVHVVRCFEDTNIIHVDETVDPLRDMDVINLELILADIVQVEKRLAKLKKDAKIKKQDPKELGALEKVCFCFIECYCYYDALFVFEISTTQALLNIILQCK
jgi:GTPase involved in cell partitioning and DNA repair